MIFARLENVEDLEQNRRNLIALTQSVFDAIVNSANRFPSQLRSMCHCLYQVLSKRFPNLLQSNIGAVGTVIFLRFINPAIGKFLIISFHLLLIIVFNLFVYILFIFIYFFFLFSSLTTRVGYRL